MFLSIQYLRFVAAIMVVIYHATELLHRDLGINALPLFSQGARGVDIFFVISGFIIVYVSQKAKYNGWGFLARRFARVAPPYYAASIVMLGMFIAAPDLLNSASLAWPHVFASFLFIPWAHPVKDAALPLLQVGWTLNAEMQFYLIFAAVFSLPFFGRVMSAACIVFVLVVTGLLLMPQNETLSAWSNVIVLEFILGMFVALAYDRNLTSQSQWLGVGICVIGVVLILALPIDLERHGLRFVIAGIPAAMIVLGLLTIEQASPVKNFPALRILGNASYSLYLWHLFALGVVKFIWRYTEMTGAINAFSFILAASSLSILVSLIAYIWIEMPLVRFATRVLVRADK